MVWKRQTLNNPENALRKIHPKGFKPRSYTALSCELLNMKLNYSCRNIGPSFDSRSMTVAIKLLVIGHQQVKEATQCHIVMNTAAYDISIVCTMRFLVVITYEFSCTFTFPLPKYGNNVPQIYLFSVSRFLTHNGTWMVSWHLQAVDMRVQSS